MNAKHYAALLALLLAASFFRWTDEEKEVETEGDIVVFRGEAADIESVRYHDKKSDATLELRGEGEDAYAWVKVDARKVIKPKPEPKPEPESTDATGDEAADAVAETDVETSDPSPADTPAEEAPVEETVEVTTTEFKGGEAADALLDSLSPLFALRVLPNVDAEKLVELELAEPEAWVEVQRKGRTQKLEIGGEAYGTRDRYVRDVESGEVYMVDADVLRPLAHAKSRLPDRKLIGLEEEAIIQVMLSGSEGDVTMVQQNRDDRKRAFWANAADTTRSVEMYENWLDKLFRLRALSYVQPDDKPDPSVLEKVFSASFKPERGEAVVLEVMQFKPEGETQVRFVAKSTHTHEWVNLHKTLAAEAVADVGAVILATPDEDAPESDAPESEDDGAVAPPQLP
jgi:hypothetical protein